MTGSATEREDPVANNTPNKLKPGRPPVYVFDKPDDQLSKNERRLKHAVMKRRLRQNRSYHRKKRLSQALTFMQRTDIPVPQPPSDVLSSSQNSPSNPVLTDQPKTIVPRELPHLPLPTLASRPATVQSFVLDDTSPPSDRHSESQGVVRSIQGSMTVTSSPASPALIALGTPSSSSRNALAPFANVYTDVVDPLSPKDPPTSGALESTSQQCSSFTPAGLMDDEDRLVQNILDLTVSPTSDMPSTSSHITSPTSPLPLASALQADFSARVNTLPLSPANAISALALFPTSFTASSAAAVVNGLAPANHPADTVAVFMNDVLMPLVRTGLLEQSGQGRFLVSTIAKRLIPSAESSALSQRAMKNFVNHFRTRLQALDPGTLSTGGSARLAAMLFYAEESQNVVAAIRFASQVSGPSGPFDVLRHAATVMRYSTAAEERVSVCSQALDSIKNDATQTTNRDVTDNHDVDKIESEARVRLALGEAYLDMLAIDTASEHIAQAVSLLARVSQKPDVCVSSVLALVLMAELRISQRAFADGSRLLVEALNALSSAGLQKSTFAACCLLSLGTVFSNMGQTERALQTVSTALDVLSGLGYEHMPIFADGLRTLGSIHLSAGNADRAQKLFISALELIGKWIELGAPIQHCMHLDIFLRELLARTYESQGRQDVADFLIEKSRQQRRERKLEEKTGAAMPRNSGSWILTRNLY